MQIFYYYCSHKNTRRYVLQKRLYSVRFNGAEYYLCYLSSFSGNILHRYYATRTSLFKSLIWFKIEHCPCSKGFLLQQSNWNGPGPSNIYVLKGPQHSDAKLLSLERERLIKPEKLLKYWHKVWYKAETAICVTNKQTGEHHGLMGIYSL